MWKNDLDQIYFTYKTFFNVIELNISNLRLKCVMTTSDTYMYCTCLIHLGTNQVAPLLWSNDENNQQCVTCKAKQNDDWNLQRPDATTSKINGNYHLDLSHFLNQGGKWTSLEKWTPRTVIQNAFSVDNILISISKLFLKQNAWISWHVYWFVISGDSRQKLIVQTAGCQFSPQRYCSP